MSGASYLAVVDDATRLCWIRLLSAKDTATAYPVLKDLMQQVETETGDKVVFVRADNGKGKF